MQTNCLHTTILCTTACTALLSKPKNTNIIKELVHEANMFELQAKCTPYDTMVPNVYCMVHWLHATSKNMTDAHVNQLIHYSAKKATDKPHPSFRHYLNFLDFLEIVCFMECLCVITDFLNCYEFHSKFYVLKAWVWYAVTPC